MNAVKSKINNLHILGAGSNTLIRDSGIKGVVIKLGSKFSQLELLEKDIIRVGAATLDKQVSDDYKNRVDDSIIQKEKFDKLHLKREIERLQKELGMLDKQA